MSSSPVAEPEDPGRADLRVRLSAAGRGSIAMLVAPVAASFMTQVWLGRRFDTTGLGEYHATSLFLIVITALLLLGFPIAAAQRAASLEEARDPRARVSLEAGYALTLLFAVGIAFLCAAAWGAYAYQLHLGNPAPVPVVALAAVGASLAAFGTSITLARLEMAWTTFLIVAQPLGVAIGILATYVGAPFGGSTLGALGFIAAGLAVVVHFSWHRFIPRYHGEEARTLMRRSTVATVVLYPAWITGWVDRLIIGYIVGPSALGAFVAASSLVEALQRVARSVSSFSVPAYARLGSDPAGVSRVLDSQVRLVSALFLLSGALFVASGDGMLTLLFGSGFGVAKTTLRLLAIALVPIGISLTIASHSVGTDPMRASARVLVLLVPLQIVVCFLATRAVSIAGTAVANLFVWTIGAFLYLLQARSHVSTVSPRALLHIAGVSVPLFVLCWYIGLQPLHWTLRAAVAALVAVPPVFLVLIRRPERRIIFRVIGSGTVPEWARRSGLA